MVEKHYLIDNKKLMEKWDWNKNNELGLNPNLLTYGSGKKIWWTFECGHSWYTTLSNMQRKPTCPYCFGNKILHGYNDFATCKPELLSEWDYGKNETNPCEIGSYSNKIVWWKCSRCGHGWKTTIASRTNGSNCPKCNSEKNTSFGEQAIYYYLKRLKYDVINRYKFNGQYEIDIFIKDLNIGIEYDGYYFHKQRIEKDTIKENKLVSNGVTLYRVIELKDKIENCYWRGNRLFYQYDQNTRLSQAIVSLFNKISIKFNSDEINISRDYSNINASYQKQLKENSIFEYSKDLVKEWDYDKNYPIIPEMVSYSSGKKVWWKCIKGHSFFQSPNTRIKGVGCPICAKSIRPKTFNESIISQRGSLFDNHPAYLDEWNYDKNNISPREVTIKSNKKFWWKYKNGHEWKTTVYNRSQGKGCPYCNNRLILKGYNDLATLQPKLSEEWNYEKNKTLLPENVFPGSAKKVWWKCKVCNCEWETGIRQRAQKGSGCPNCRKSKNKTN